MEGCRNVEIWGARSSQSSQGRQMMKKDVSKSMFFGACMELEMEGCRNVEIWGARSTPGAPRSTQEHLGCLGLPASAWCVPGGIVSKYSIVSKVR